ncbi:hypothetical protein HT576_08860 [Haloterrigena sp. SYSU A121-1]|uniref:Uncharacterized protein n=1 Tax=Haloterrigena gelatinilytica TaxID=2741724 RepID=A0A8J8GPE9_9EURY|nr:hypothetical protein [Haloterrigena gelatinilytica]NUB91130.1 hypothetical protein [Haloterrigena gelatinilytica]
MRTLQINWYDILERWITGALFLSAGYLAAYGDWIVAFAAAFVGVYLAVYQQEQFWQRIERVRNKQLRSIPIDEYELRHESGIRTLVAYLRGGRK